MKLKTRAVHKELEHESTRLAACLCAAVDAVKQAEAHAAKKYPIEVKPAAIPQSVGGSGMFSYSQTTTIDSELRFISDNITSIALSMYIRKRDESKGPQQWNRREKTDGGGSNL